MSASQVKHKTKLFLQDQKNANLLVEILELLHSDEEQLVLACIRSLHKIFSLLIVQQPVIFAQDKKDDDGDGDVSLHTWFLERYNDTCRGLCELIAHPNQRVQELALCTLMKLFESKGSVLKCTKTNFPIDDYDELMEVLISDHLPKEDLINQFKDFMKFDDVRYATIKYLIQTLKKMQDVELSVCCATNFYAVIETISVPKEAEDNILGSFLVKLPDKSSSYVQKMKSLVEQKKLFSRVVIEFLRHKIPSTALYKKILLGLHDKVIPSMSNPLVLSDFLTTSYDVGGAISLLSLNSLFLLVNKYNLEYPDFYKKLYILFQPTVLHVRYKARFFHLADLFLTSTHVPSYLVAAFIKRLARLALTAPPNGLEILLPFILNLLYRHPTCNILLHRQNSSCEMSRDPYNYEETDPAKCNALESSLWELSTLNSHYHHYLARKAGKILNTTPDEETDLANVLEMETHDIFLKEVKNNINELPVTFETPNGLLGSKNDTFSDLWTL